VMLEQMPGRSFLSVAPRPGVRSQILFKVELILMCEMEKQ
jgi:hypothetical protein